MNFDVDTQLPDRTDFEHIPFSSSASAGVLAEYAKAQQVVMLPSHGVYLCALPVARVSSLSTLQATVIPELHMLPHIVFSSLDQLKRYTKNRPEWVDILIMVFQDDIAIELDCQCLPGIRGRIVAMISTHPAVQNFFEYQSRPVLVSPHRYATDSDMVQQVQLPWMDSGRCRNGVMPTWVSAAQPADCNHTNKTAFPAMLIHRLGTVSDSDIAAVLPWMSVQTVTRDSYNQLGAFHHDISSDIRVTSSVTLVGTREGLDTLRLPPDQDGMRLINLGSQTDWRQIVHRLHFHMQQAMKQDTDAQVVVPFSIRNHWSRLIAQECQKYQKKPHSKKTELPVKISPMQRYFYTMTQRLT